MLSGYVINESALNVLSYLYYRVRSFIKLSETEADADIYQFGNKLSSYQRHCCLPPGKISRFENLHMLHNDGKHKIFHALRQLITFHVHHHSCSSILFLFDISLQSNQPKCFCFISYYAAG